jgi:site-specific DNA-methyltransferase (adenine-specific)
VLETIARNDKPHVRGVTGMRDWSDTKSKFCVPKEVADEFEKIVKDSKARYIVMSYNNEGLLSKEAILKLLGKYGNVNCEEIPYERYSRTTSGKSKVVEYLFTWKRVEQVPTALTTWYNKLYNEDCLEGMKRIPDKSVHMILTDLPYGLTECKWDSVLPLASLWKEYRRIITLTGAIVLFGQQPFTSVLIASNLEMFKYSLVWKKTKTGNFAQAPYRFLCQHEDIAVFSFGKVAKNGKHRMCYYPQGTTACKKVMKGKSGTTEHREGRATQSDYVQTVTNYPRSILEFANEGKPEHPTQKPVDLCEYLIKSYTQEGEIVLDSCMGSGTTAVAAIQTKRNYIGFEKDTSYYDYAVKRIAKARPSD